MLFSGVRPESKPNALLHPANYLPKASAHTLVGMALIITLCWPPAIIRASENEPIWIGVAKRDVTPKSPVVLAGYGGRTEPYESISTRLWARAIVLGKKDPAVFVVVDNCGITEARYGANSGKTCQSRFSQGAYQRCRDSHP